MDPHQWMLCKLVDPYQRVPLAYVLWFLELSDRLAQDCALAQAALAPESARRRFLLMQARQEASHAAVVKNANFLAIPSLPRRLPRACALGIVSYAHR